MKFAETAEYEENLIKLKSWAHVLELALLAPDGEVTYQGRDALVRVACDLARLAVVVECDAMSAAKQLRRMNAV
ncbi:hypothetical protein [Sedimentitalea nanhaiensis]|uniref:Uncharacterized protein n=1 Tax=Sedimentitalea nanhaiensis TaxID=999627 RepID=A0A1I7CL69_9RHOB|nr:hypothetical protein [Sedimentitalea nanhaiensis]SFU00158.1 hypothetical protein SAMN05216236_11786 [Sedimentitalea nanhaiensis]